MSYSIGNQSQPYREDEYFSEREGSRSFVPSIVGEVTFLQERVAGTEAALSSLFGVVKDQDVRVERQHVTTYDLYAGAEARLSDLFGIKDRQEHLQTRQFNTSMQGESARTTQARSDGLATSILLPPKPSDHRLVHEPSPLFPLVLGAEKAVKLAHASPSDSVQSSSKRKLEEADEKKEKSSQEALSPPPPKKLREDDSDQIYIETRSLLLQLSNSNRSYLDDLKKNRREASEGDNELKEKLSQEPLSPPPPIKLQEEDSDQIYEETYSLLTQLSSSNRKYLDGLKKKGQKTLKQTAAFLRNYEKK